MLTYHQGLLQMLSKTHLASEIHDWLYTNHVVCEILLLMTGLNAIM